MGCYDTFIDGKLELQTKSFGRLLRHYKMFDPVPNNFNLDLYQVEAGGGRDIDDFIKYYLLVSHGIITGYSQIAFPVITYDYYGNYVALDTPPKVS